MYASTRTATTGLTRIKYFSALAGGRTVETGVWRGVDPRGTCVRRPLGRERSGRPAVLAFVGDVVEGGDDISSPKLNADAVTSAA